MNLYAILRAALRYADIDIGPSEQFREAFVALVEGLRLG